MAYEIVGPQQCKNIPSLRYTDLLQLDEAAWTAGALSSPISRTPTMAMPASLTRATRPEPFVQQSLMACRAAPNGWNRRARPATSVSLGIGEPVQQSDAGASGTPNGCCEYAT
jgi:hypothetical protein